MDPRLHRLLPHHSTSDNNRLGNSGLSFQEESAILRAAVDFNALRFRNSISGAFPHGHLKTAQYPHSLSAAQGQTNAALSILALLRSNESYAAMTYANLRINPYHGSLPTSGAFLPIGRAEMMTALSKASTQEMPSLAQSTTTAAINATTCPRGSALQIVKDSNAEALEALGANCLQRRNQKSPYFDASALSDPDAAAVANRTRGGVTEPFPEKLYRMLKEAKREGKEDVISFFPHGRAFGIHKPARFANEIMPKFFKQSRVSSFQRQLNLYGFTRINTGPDAGGYYHELFLRGRPALGAYIRRVGVPQAVPRKRGVRAHDSTIDPDFYSMEPIKESTSMV